MGQKVSLTFFGYTTIHDDFNVHNTTLQIYLNVILPPLKCSLLNQLLCLMSLGEINNISVRKAIPEKIAKQKLGQKKNH